MFEPIRHTSRACQCLQDCALELVGARRVDEKSELSMQERFLAAIDAASYHWDTTGKCLEKNNSKALATARHYVGVGYSIVVRLAVLRHKAGKTHSMRDVQA